MKWKPFAMFVSLILSLGMVGVLAVSWDADKKNSSNTTEYAATFSSVEIIDTGSETYTMLQTEEYENDFHISSGVTGHIINQLKELESGERIYFSIPNIEIEQINKVDFINIVSLRTQEKEILSLSDYNGYTSLYAKLARLAGVVFVTLLLLFSLYCALSMRCKNSRESG